MLRNKTRVVKPDVTLDNATSLDQLSDLVGLNPGEDDRKSRRDEMKEDSAHFQKPQIALGRRPRWLKKPDTIPECHLGDDPIWEGEGESFQNQLWCNVYSCYINPDGHTCDLCIKRLFPAALKVRVRIRMRLAGMIEAGRTGAELETSKEKLRGHLVREVRDGHITRYEAEDILEAELPEEE